MVKNPLCSGLCVIQYYHKNPGKSRFLLIVWIDRRKYKADIDNNMYDTNDFLADMNTPRLRGLERLTSELKANPYLTLEDLDVLRIETKEDFRPSKFSNVMLYIMIIFKLLGVITLIVAVLALIIACIGGGISFTKGSLIFDVSRFVIPVSILIFSIVISFISQMIIVGRVSGVLHTLGTPFDKMEKKSYIKKINSIIENRASL
jgi:hypothetical protein